MKRKDRTTPYTPEEERVSAYIQEITHGQVGSGDDPIGFILASHAELSRVNQVRVDSYLRGGMPTAEGVTALMNKIWEVTHRDIPAEKMLPELCFVCGVAMAVLRHYKDHLAAEEAGQ